MVKSRLDVLLVKRELVSSREEAQRYIRAGKVLVDEMVVDKPGAGVAEESVIRVKLPETMYASRGGTKLEGALERFQIQVDGLTCADLGASNGGFTDCLLQRGARKVFAIDVGHGQLAYHLQTDERVVDQTNCRYLKPVIWERRIWWWGFIVYQHEGGVSGDSGDIEGGWRWYC